MGLSASLSCVCLLHSTWHRPLHGVDRRQLLVGWNKCITPQLCSLIWTDRNHFHRWTQVAAAVCSVAEDVGYVLISVQYMAEDRSNLLPAVRRRDTELSPALACGLGLAHVIPRPKHMHLG